MHHNGGLPRWGWAAGGIAILVFTTLGAWQLQRGFDKRALQDAVAALPDAPVQDLSAASRAEDGAGGPARAAGTYAGDRQLLLDGQAHGGEPGFHVWTPLRLDDGARVVVNRGWVPLAVDLTTLAPPAGRVEVAGRWRTLPKPALRLEAPCRRAEQATTVVIYPTPEDVHCLLGEPVLSGLLLLAPEAPHGFVREWSTPGFPPERHYAYAAQWFALGIATAILLVILHRKATR